MAERESFCGASLEAGRRIIQRLRRWWRSESAEEQYLAAASDVADLERRMQELERTREGPMFVTFNH
ncbi:MAG TPA: DUF3563 family protein [Burkholderiales bacterium]|jgi:hypothetical protein|nr:DUF3563 family protein [Burkholderiales bacterium]